MKRLSLIALLLLLTACSPKGATGSGELTVEWLPEMPLARASHLRFAPEGEITVVGGHTSGYLPTQSACYYVDGAWHEAGPSFYPHDSGFSVALEDGTVMLGGGSAEPFGIGQSWGVELYNPVTHSFTALDILDRKRALSSALNLGGDRILVSGNWHADDAIALYEPGMGFRTVKTASQQRLRPFLFQTAPDNALIFGGRDNYGNLLDTVLVDRLQGDPFTVPLLEDWSFPLMMDNFVADDFSIGQYTYLLPVSRKTDGQMALLKVSGEQFSLLETEEALPMSVEGGARLAYSPFCYVDRPARHAFLQAEDENGRLYVVRVDYDATFEGGKASVSMFSLPFPFEQRENDIYPLFLPGGRFVITGGSPRDNFNPYKQAFILHTEPPLAEKHFPWGPIGIVLLVAAAGVAAGLLMGRRKAPAERPATADSGEKTDLMTRITTLMDQEELFRRKDLRVADVARELGTNTTYISACINGQCGISFTEFVTGYRVRYAQKLMTEQPQTLLSHIGEEAGFASEKSFYRGFKAVTGLTPSEWKAGKST